MTAAFLERLNDRLDNTPISTEPRAGVQQYVVVYAAPTDVLGHVLLIEKKRPAWQNGRFNLPGGHVEYGESIHEAAVRELQEETGLICELDNAKLLGVIEGDDWEVFVVRCNYNHEHQIEQMTDEPVFWMSLEDFFRDPRIMGNLRVIVPFCIAGLMGWTLRDNSEIYTIEVADADSAVS